MKISILIRCAFIVTRHLDHHTKPCTIAATNDPLRLILQAARHPTWHIPADWCCLSRSIRTDWCTSHARSTSRLEADALHAHPAHRRLWRALDQVVAVSHLDHSANSATGWTVPCIPGPHPRERGGPGDKYCPAWSRRDVGYLWLHDRQCSAGQDHWELFLVRVGLCCLISISPYTCDNSKDYYKWKEKPLTVIIQIKRPCWCGRIGVKLRFGIVLILVPKNLTENRGTLLLGESIDTGNLLNLPRLE